MIAVMGATGNVGGSISERLMAQGEEVRVLGRSEQKLEGLVERGADGTVGEATDPEYLASAFQGAQAAFALIPPNLQSEDYGAFQDRVGRAIVRAIEDSGLRHLVFLSSVGADQPAGTGPIAGLHRAEQRLRALGGLNVLALRPGFFFENHMNTLGLIKHEGINGGATAPDTVLPMIATADIAAVATDALVSRDFEGFVVRELLGPRDLTMAEATRIIGTAIGKLDLAYVQFPYEAYEASLTELGLSESTAGMLAEMEQGFNEGKVRSLEGRSPSSTTPTSFEEFAEEVLTKAYEEA